MNFFIVISYILSALLAIGFPIILATILRKKSGARWRFWWYGVLVMLFFQGLTRIPAMLFLQSQKPIMDFIAQSELLLLGFAFFAAFTAGLFEEGGRWIAYRFFIKPQDRTFQNGLMMGAGHGGLEAIVIGFIVLLSLVAYIAIMTVSPATLAELGQDPAALEQAKNSFTQMPSWMPLLSGWERVSTLFIHIGLSVMVLLSFTKGFRFWWYALATHTLVDFVPTLILRYVPKALPGNMALVLTEIVISIFAIASYLFIKKLFLTQKSEG